MSRDTPIRWVWIPLHSVGPVRFEDPINSLVRAYSLSQCEPIEGHSVPWITYKFPNAHVYVHARGDRVESATLFDELLCGNTNLLSCTKTRMREILGRADEIGEQILGREPWTYERLGIQMWFEGDRAQSAVVSGEE